MKNEKNLVQRLNDAISNMGYGMGPSSTNLILYGPIDRKLIDGENLDILKSNEEVFEDNYKNYVFPKSKGVIRTITRRNPDFPSNKKELYRSFRSRTPEGVRKKLRDSYKGQFELDKPTAEALFSESKICNESYRELKFFFNKGSEDMFGIKYKTPEKIREKLCINFEKMTRTEKANFLGFVVDVAEHDYTFWKDYDKYSKKYSKKVLDMMIGDFAGIKIVDLNQERAEKTMKKLFKNRKRTNFYNFFVIDKMFDDHRGRNKEGRPGGIHYTLVDKSLVNYPVEVQFKSIKDEFFNLFGKHAHYFYSLAGKKSSPLIGD